MPLTLLNAEPLLAFDLKDQAEFWIYRIGGYLLINVIDDPAWLALMFC
jgi:hypothetical protein